MDVVSNATDAAAAGLLQQSLLAAPFQNWPAAAATLLIGGLTVVLVQAAWRQSFPKSAPAVLGSGNWPILGALKFFSDRANFVYQAQAASKSGNFSFHLGKLQVVGVSGREGRKTFFESRELNMAEGYAVLFANTPSVEGVEGIAGDPSSPHEMNSWFNKTLIRMMKRENFVRNLSTLVNDSHRAIQAAAARSDVMDPFDDIYRIVYQLTMRTVGATEIAESPELLRRSLELFETIENSSSPARVIFPWLPTPAHLRRMASGAKLYIILNNIIEERKKTGTRYDDALQFLMDSGESVAKIVQFILGSLFAGQLNSGINAGWLFIYLATNPEWYARVQAEVDGVVAKHRTSPTQTPTDVLSTIEIDVWESEFPLIDVALRECIRFQMLGTAFRKNMSGRDVPIGSTGEVIPRDAFAIYLIDDIHMDPEVYSDVERWDPGRYLPDRAEDKKVSQGYIGWGVGRHPCLGMKFAKLEMAIIGALFVAMFDYEALDGEGNVLKEQPWTDRNKYSASKPDQAMRLRMRARE